MSEIMESALAVEEDRDGRPEGAMHEVLAAAGTPRLRALLLEVVSGSRSLNFLG